MPFFVIYLYFINIPTLVHNVKNKPNIKYSFPVIRNKKTGDIKKANHTKKPKSIK